MRLQKLKQAVKLKLLRLKQSELRRPVQKLHRRDQSTGCMTAASTDDVSGGKAKRQSPQSAMHCSCARRLLAMLITVVLRTISSKQVALLPHSSHCISHSLAWLITITKSINGRPKRLGSVLCGCRSAACAYSVWETSSSPDFSIVEDDGLRRPWGLFREDRAALLSCASAIGRLKW